MSSISPMMQKTNTECFRYRITGTSTGGMRFLETVISLIILRCDRFLSSRGVTDSLDKFTVLSDVVSGLSNSDVERWAYVMNHSDAENPVSATGHLGGSEAGAEEPLSLEESRYLTLVSGLDNRPELQSLLDLCLAVFAYPEFDAYLTHHFGYSVNLHLAYMLEGVSFPDEKDILDALTYVRMICNVDVNANPLQYAPLVTDERIYAYLSGDDSINPALSDFTELIKSDKIKELNAPFVNEELIKKGIKFIKDGGSVLQISGSGGRRYMARQVSASADKDLLMINIADLFAGNDRKNLNTLKGALIREARLDNAAICIYGITGYFLNGGAQKPEARAGRDLEMLERMLFAPVIAEGILLILISDDPVILIRSLPETGYRIIELPRSLEYEDRLKLWKGFDKYYKLKVDPEDMAVRYHLNASESASVIKSFLERRDKDDADTQDLLSRISIERMGDTNEAQIGRVIYPTVRLDNVKIKPEIRSVLNDVVSSVRVSARILDSWDLRSSYPYGRCVSLLMSGPPGTGKTMTANAIAGELGLPLYQVNLANIVDKYIGETEKNLEKAFSYAEKTNMVLFFDEADSLFGTRSEVHDSKDRYANNEISYLLQRIEAYDGIVIMATNIKSNIDPAFSRRIRYVVHFENPDEELRRQIWQSCIRDSIPHEEIDVDYLASQFDKFTGSVIKTVFLNACAYAAGLDEDLGMKHLIHAIKYELEKTTSVGFTMDTLGKYAYLN